MPGGECACDVLSGWSGWPGAHCLTCGKEDPKEAALAVGELIVAVDAVGEPTGPTLWASPEAKAKYDLGCPLKRAAVVHVVHGAIGRWVGPKEFDTPLDALGLDSLEMVQTLLDLEDIVGPQAALNERLRAGMTPSQVAEMVVFEGGKVPERLLQLTAQRA
jgi:hypothetical protein